MHIRQVFNIFDIFIVDILVVVSDLIDDGDIKSRAATGEEPVMGTAEDQQL